MTTETFIPGDLIVNDYPVATQPCTIITGQVLARGAVLGRITASGKLTQSLAASGDGSQVPVSVLAVDVDATSGDVAASDYVSGAFDSSKLIVGTGHDVDSVESAFRAASAPLFVKKLA